MKIKLIRASVDNYVTTEFIGQSKTEVENAVAAICREAWTARDWSWLTEDDSPGHPEIPETDKEVLNLYFGEQVHNEEDPAEMITWDELKIDLSPPRTFEMAGKIVVQAWDNGFASVDGCLVGPQDPAGEALESFITALAAEGVPLHLPEFERALKTTLEAMENNT